jgi:hypothetical protein
LGCPRAIPWDLIAPFEAQALINHDQSLQRLAERGGLSPDEMLAVMENRKFKRMSLEDAVEGLKGKLAGFSK